MRKIVVTLFIIALVFLISSSYIQSFYFIKFKSRVLENKEYKRVKNVLLDSIKSMNSRSKESEEEIDLAIDTIIFNKDYTKSFSIVLDKDKKTSKYRGLFLVNGYKKDSLQYSQDFKIFIAFHDKNFTKNDAKWQGALIVMGMNYYYRFSLIKREKFWNDYIYSKE